MTEMGAITTREALIYALTGAAEREHIVTCQYLFAAFSLKKDLSEGNLTWPQLESIREWQATLFLVARQEMEHLGIVCNLLSAIGGTPHFRRGAFELQPFSEAALERFMALEEAHSFTDADAPAGDHSAICALYATIRQGFEDVAATNKKLFIGPRAAQVSNETLDLPKGWYDVDLLNVVDLEMALQAVDHVVEAGAGTPGHPGDDHYARFERTLHELRHMRQDDPAFEPARPVVANPHVEEHDAGPAPTLIRHPVTRRAARLFNTAYETMNLMLLRFYTPTDETEEEREGLRKIAFFPLMTMVLRPLGETLTLMPVSHELPGRTAGPSFEGHRDVPLQPHKQSAWTVLHERLQAMAEDGGRLVHDLVQEDASWARAIHPRLSFLHENLEAMAVNFERYMDLKQVHLNHLLKRVF